MNLQKLILTNNACYKAGRTIPVKGIMVHSTGSNNPNLKRYIAPDDGLLGKNQYGNHWNQNTPDGQKVCVHGFIGKLADGSVATYQTLPWNHRGWHAGGAANDTHIGFEICEDALTDVVYFRKVFKEAVELCAYLCKMYNLDPMKDGVIIGHYEGYKRGIASNHADPGHWFPKHGESMSSFRAAVKRSLETPVQADDRTSSPNITEGSLVEIKDGIKNYYPGGPAIPAWVISDYTHRVTQVNSGGKPVDKGGKTCVLLGKKVSKKTGIEEAGINTWIDKGALEVVFPVTEYEIYIVASGDTLWKIAEKTLGSGGRYTEIKTLNNLLSDIIVTGQRLKIPKK